MTTRSSASSTVAFAWRQWATENLLRGASAEEVVASLVAEGVPERDARALTEELQASAAFHAALELAQRERRYEMVLELERLRLREMRVPRRSGVTPEELHLEYRAGRRPIVLTDLLESTQALKTWSHAHFAERFRGVPMAVRDCRQGERKTLQLPVDGLVELWRTDPNAHLLYSMARNDVLRSEPFSRLVAEVELAPGFIVPSMRELSTAMWFGPAGTITPLHFDTTDVLLAQVFGGKRVQLVAPCEEREVAPFRRGHMVPDSRFEELASRVHVHEVELGAGDTLLIPVGWYHRVTARSASITVSLNGFDTPEADWYTPGQLVTPRAPEAR